MYYGHVSTTSNREDWTETIVLTDLDTGELIDISGCRITMTVATFPVRTTDYSYNGSCNVLLTGSTDSGEISVVEDGTFMWLFPADQMANLSQGEYQIGLRIVQEDRVRQLVIGVVDVFEGFDAQ